MTSNPAASKSPLAAARELYPLLSAASVEIEEKRRLTPAAVAALKASRLFRLCVPERYAGLEASPVDMVESVAELSRADASSGWCVAIGATSGLLGGYLPEADAREIFASDPESVAGGVFAPRGQAVAEHDA